MRDMSFMTYPESPRQRAMFKWPVNLWRLGLAPFLGRFMMLITHTGRKSGLPRRTMTESYRLNEIYYAPCAFGERAQWYQNIMADPHVTIQTDRGAQSSVAVRVTDGEEILALLESVRKRSQTIFGMYLDYLGVSSDPKEILANRDRIYWFRFDPTSERAPRPLKADLLWIWPVAALAVATLILTVLRKKNA